MNLANTTTVIQFRILGTLKQLICSKLPIIFWFILKLFRNDYNSEIWLEGDKFKWLKYNTYKHSLSGMYTATWNISRTVCVTLMQLCNQSRGLVYTCIKWTSVVMITKLTLRCYWVNLLCMWLSLSQ